jgi:hypothetical protein
VFCEGGLDDGGGLRGLFFGALRVEVNVVLVLVAVGRH